MCKIGCIKAQTPFSPFFLEQMQNVSKKVTFKIFRLFWLFAWPSNFGKRFPSINPFQVNVPFLYLLKTSENQRFSDVFRGYRKGTFTWNGLQKLVIMWKYMKHWFKNGVVYISFLSLSEVKHILRKPLKIRKISRPAVPNCRNTAWPKV